MNPCRTPLNERKARDQSYSFRQYFGPATATTPTTTHAREGIISKVYNLFGKKKKKKANTSQKAELEPVVIEQWPEEIPDRWKRPHTSTIPARLPPSDQTDPSKGVGAAPRQMAALGPAVVAAYSHLGAAFVFVRNLSAPPCY
jgi:hypothetical protein